MTAVDWKSQLMADKKPFSKINAPGEDNIFVVVEVSPFLHLERWKKDMDTLERV